MKEIQMGHEIQNNQTKPKQSKHTYSSVHRGVGGGGITPNPGWEEEGGGEIGNTKIVVLLMRTTPLSI